MDARPDYAADVPEGWGAAPVMISLPVMCPRCAEIPAATVPKLRLVKP